MSVWRLEDETSFRTHTPKTKGARIFLCVLAKIGQLCGSEDVIVSEPALPISAIGQVIKVTRGRILFVDRLRNHRTLTTVSSSSTELRTYKSGVQVYWW